MNYDRVEDVTTTTGTGSYTLAGTPPAGRRSFASGVGVGNTCCYFCTDGTSWETGVGTLSAATTLARTSVEGGTNGTSPVNWGAGTKTIFVFPNQAHLIVAASDFTVPIPGGLKRLSNNALTLKTRTFLTSGSGTYTTPTGVRALRVICVGGGGGGGGCPASTASNSAFGGSGGGGGYVDKWIASPAASYAYAVGALGGGGAAGANAGTAGGNTTFGSAFLTANGGSGGSAGTNGASINNSPGAAGGSASGGDLNVAGGKGAAGGRLSANSCFSGNGGSTPLGNGGGGAFAHTGQTTDAGNPGNGYGAGGSGGCAGNAGAAQAGGAGTAGIIIIEEWY
jgi:hypothetical protein